MHLGKNTKKEEKLTSHTAANYLIENCFPNVPGTFTTEILACVRVNRLLWFLTSTTIIYAPLCLSVSNQSKCI